MVRLSSSINNTHNPETSFLTLELIVHDSKVITSNHVLLTETITITENKAGITKNPEYIVTKIICLW